MPVFARSSFAVLFVFAAHLVAASNQPFTIAQAMSASFASDPTSAPDGTKVAWLENNQGKRNIWIAAAPMWTGRALTAFDQDDGQEIDELAWAPDGSYLLFVRGGDFENAGENPNPAWSPAKPDQQIWYVAMNGGVPKKLTEGHSPAISSAGTIAFLRAGQIYTLNPAADFAKSEPKNIVTQPGQQSTLRWSPDGTQLAFVSARHGHSFIGLYTASENRLRYLDSSVDEDISPIWSPDGARVAYLRIPAGGPIFGPGPEREGEPWSIRVADAKTATSRQAFKATPGRGSVFHGIVAPGQLFWAGDRLIFPWERSGWCHLYSLLLDGQSPVELTPGEGEVEHVALSPDLKTIYFSGNFSDIDRRHLWRLNVTEGAPHLVTSGEDIEWSPAPLGNNSVLAFLSSSSSQRAHAMLRLSDGNAKPLSSGPPSAFPAASFVKPLPVMITAADGLLIHGQVFLPPNSKPGERHPALVFFHGGSRRQMLLGFHYRSYYSNAYALNQYFASQGYVVLSVNYRSGIGYGLDFREAIGYGAQGGSEFNDVIGAGLYLKNRPDVEPNHIGIWGGSYGGYLTAMGLSRASNLFAAGVDFHGVHDWSRLRDAPARVAGGDPKQQRAFEEALRLAFESSPMASLDTWKSPALLIHGDDDRNVSFSQTVILVEALRQRHVEFEQLIFPNEIHDFLLHRSWLTAYQAAADFFARKLR